MGRILRMSSAVERIVHAIEQTTARATAHGGPVEAAANAWLSVIAAAIAPGKAAVATAQAAAETATAGWLVAAEDATRGMGLVQDLMYNACDRPASHPALDTVLPAGLATYTEVSRERLPEMMQVFVARLASVTAPPWTAAQQADWTAQIEALRTPLVAAATAAQTADLGLRIAETSLFAIARQGRRALVALKRDLLSMGMTEFRIHQIIPDASPRSPDATTAVTPTGSGPPALAAAVTQAPLPLPPIAPPIAELPAAAPPPAARRRQRNLPLRILRLFRMVLESSP